MNRKGSVDLWLIGTVVILCGAGLVFLYSSSAWISERTTSNPHYMFLSQAVKAAMGMALMFLVSLVDYRRYAGRWGWAVFGVTMLMLAFLAIPHGYKETVRHTDRWIQLGPFSIQPSEFARVAVLVVLAATAAKVRTWSHPRVLVGSAALVLGPVLLVLLQPNFGTAMTMGLSAIVLLVLAGLPWSWLFGGVGVLAGLGALLTTVYHYPLERIARWLDSLRDWDAVSFQIQQGTIALGSGGLWGVGLGESLQKRLFVPDPHTDLILAIIGEEMGFVGVMVLIGLFGLLLARGFRIAREAPDRFGFLLAAGITVQLGMYILINAGVVTGLLPVTGLPLPFVSYGGSALMANLASVGVLISVSRASGWSRGALPRRVMAIESG